MLLRSGDDQALTVGEDIGERVILKQGESVVGGEAGPLAGSGQDDPGARGGRAGEAAEETGELPRSAKGSVAFLQQGLDCGNLSRGEIWGRSSWNRIVREMEKARPAVAAGIWQIFPKVTHEVPVEAVIFLGVG